MSVPQNSVSPFITVTTPTMERAQRLISLRDHPGFRDLIRVSQELVDMVTAEAIGYPGWDKDQAFTLLTRAKAAKEHHIAWLGSIQAAIEAGEAEARTLLEESRIPTKSAAEIIEQSDVLRMRALQKVEEFDGLLPGTY